MNKHEIIKKHTDKIHKNLINKMRIFGLIFIGTLGYVIFDMIKFEINYWYIILAFAVGCIVGLMLGRMQKITRDEDEYKIISRMDTIGVIILVLYICFGILRHMLIADRVDPTAVTIVTISVVSGTMIGRLVTMRYFIKNILQDIKETEKDL